MDVHIFYVLSFLLLFIPSTDAAAITISQTSDSVNFVKGENATLYWSVSISGSMWSYVLISRTQQKLDAPVVNIIKIVQNKLEKTTFAGFQDRAVDVNVEGVPSVFNVTFTLKNLTTTDQMWYRIFVHADEAAVFNDKYVFMNVLALPGTPVIQVKPDQPQLCANNNITINCTAALGNPTNTNLTFHQNNSIFQTENGTQGGVAVITKTLMQAGTFSFSCFATNRVGTTPSSNVVTITVKDPPVINCTIKDVKEFENLSWTCEVSGSKPLTTSWHKGNNMTVFRSGRSLTIANVSRADNGNYTFKASNGEGCDAANKTVQLDVQYKPEQHSIPQASNGYIVVSEGDTVNITCSAKGNPKPYYQWSFGVQMLSGITNDTISIKATKDDDGIYACTAINEVGNSTTTVTLRVHYIDNASCDASPNPVSENSNFTLNCSALGYPPVNYTWMLLENKQVYQPTTTVKATVMHNGAVMTCKAQNDVGIKTCNKTITVHYKPRNVAVSPARVPPLNINDSFSLNCTDTSNPAGNYTWSMDGKLLTAETSSTLSKANVTPQDAGHYTCTVANSEGSVTSNVVVVNVNYIGEATCDASPSTVKENANFVLNCSAAGYPPVNYTWVLPGSEDVNQPMRTVNASVAHNGVTVTCKAMNGFGNKECTKTITVHYKPRNVAVSPARVIVLNINDSFSLNCTATSNPAGNYTWSLNGKLLTGEMGSTLSKASVTPQDAGHYTCTVTNSEGSTTSNVVVIYVNYFGEASCDAIPSTVKENANFVLNCSAAGYPPVNYTWVLPGSQAVNQPIRTVNASIAHDGVAVTCKAMNGFGNKECRKNITVHYKPRNIKVSPASVPALNINDSFFLNCTATSNPAGNYTWSLNEKPLTGETGSTLSKASVTPQDAGHYTCTVANSEGSTTSNVVVINVYDSPKIECDPQRVVQENTTDFVFQCNKPSGFPTPSLTALFNGKKYDEGNVAIRRVDKTLNGSVIQCFANNSLSNASCETKLVIGFFDSLACPSRAAILKNGSRGCISIPVDGNPKPILKCGGHNVTNNDYTICSEEVDEKGINCYINNAIGNCNFTMSVVIKLEIEIKRTYTLILNLDFVVNLADKKSDSFKNMKKTLEEILKKIYKFVKYVTGIEVLEFFPGSTIVNFELTMIANVSDPLVPLNEELKRTNDTLGGQYSVASLQTGSYVPSITPSTTTTTPSTTAKTEPQVVIEPPSIGIIVAIVIGCVVFVILIILLVYCCWCKDRNREYKDMHSEEGRGIPMENKESVSNTANGTHNERPVVGVENEGMSGSPRATAKHQNAANGNNNADNDFYAQVDRSKKTKKPKDDEVLYADLSHINGGKKSGAADLSLNSSGKFPEKYESEYAEIVGIRRDIQSEEKQGTDNPDKKEEAPSASTSQTNPADKEEETPSASTSQTNNDTKEDEGSQVGVEVKGTSSAPTSANSSSTRDHTTLTTVSM